MDNTHSAVLCSFSRLYSCNQSPGSVRHGGNTDLKEGGLGDPEAWLPCGIHSSNCLQMLHLISSNQRWFGAGAQRGALQGSQKRLHPQKTAFFDLYFSHDNEEGRVRRHLPPEVCCWSRKGLSPLRPASLYSGMKGKETGF